MVARRAALGEIVNDHQLEIVDALASELKHAPGVDMVARFGLALHVAGRDAEAMTKVIERYANPAQQWARDQATLEDVFIELMTRNHEGAA